MQIETRKLTGTALIWAVARALNLAPLIVDSRVAYKSDHGPWVHPNYTDDAEAVELMQQQWIGVERPSRGQKTPVWQALTESKMKPKPLQPVVSAFGVSIGIAVCRALVLSHFGDTIEIPDEVMAKIA